MRSFIDSSFFFELGTSWTSCCCFVVVVAATAACAWHMSGNFLAERRETLRDTPTWVTSSQCTFGPYIKYIWPWSQTPTSKYKTRLPFLHIVRRSLTYVYLDLDHRVALWATFKIRCFCNMMINYFNFHPSFITWLPFCCRCDCYTWQIDTIMPFNIRPTKFLHVRTTLTSQTKKSWNHLMRNQY